MPKYNFKFTQDWFTHSSEHIAPILSKYVTNRAVKFLEIGSFEGRSTMWFLENYCQHPYASITSVDYVPSPLLGHNLSLLDGNDRKKVINIRDKSVNVLPTLSTKFDFIFIDGSHFPDDVMMDAVLSFRLLKPGGVMIFDDFNMRSIESYNYLTVTGRNLYKNVYAKDILANKWDVLPKNLPLEEYEVVNPFEAIQYFYLAFASSLEPIPIQTRQLAGFVKKSESFFDTLPGNVWM